MKKIIYVLMFLSAISLPVTLRASEKIAPYLLDGSLVLYFPNISAGLTAWRTLVRKMYGVESVNASARLEEQIRERLGINIFNPREAESFGLDSKKAMAYVYLKEDLAYGIFTVKNPELLVARLNNLANPIPFRLEDEFVIFSASIEILEYYNFKGLGKVNEFQQIAKEVRFDWKQNFIWMDSSYFENRSLLSVSELLPQGNRIAGTFSITDKEIYIDVVTVYDDPTVIREIRKSIQVPQVQEETLLDFEFGEPAVVGQLNLRMRNFLDMLMAIDRENHLDVKTLLRDFENLGVDIYKDLLPYLTGRFSYVVRAYKPTEGILDFSLNSQLNDKRQVISNIRTMIRSQESRGVQVRYKDLFTQQFYGWDFKDLTLWVGVVEDNLLISTDEESLTRFVQNIYQNKRGFMRQLPTSFQRLVKARSTGGQMYIQNPAYIQNFSMNFNSIPISFVSAAQDMIWNFYFVDLGQNMGRRDVITIKFIN